ncbi:hypothetical protein CONLIGDRAFT_686036 [Coniochaeta ligniaria NRRL 30616]|uniref:Uncharacterized protein n=1 Tax=Coniochaeta ligniaria NRRL 30616 TaxID=1408157 RepID=A0A1J7I8M9_9PEZI|nr:hypothetical protein CONLIGDRAFT_686036 [Coniochaeta ligniaria NRRL 30616]
MSDPSDPSRPPAVPFFPVIRDGTYAAHRPAVPDEQPSQTTRGGNHPIPPAIARSTSNYTVQFPEMFNRNDSQQQASETTRRVQDHLGRGPFSTNPSFTSQLANVDNLSRPVPRSHPSTVESVRDFESMRHLFRPMGPARDITPAGDFPVRVEKRSVRHTVDPAVWEIDDGLKTAWRTHLDGQRKGSH